jgi:hypothetical protein
MSMSAHLHAGIAAPLLRVTETGQSPLTNAIGMGLLSTVASTLAERADSPAIITTRLLLAQLD